jgi:hypothetical protein
MKMRERTAKQFRNYGELLYTEGLLHREKMVRRIDQKQKDDRAKEMVEVTGKPEIRCFSSSLESITLHGNNITLFRSIAMFCETNGIPHNIVVITSLRSLTMFCGIDGSPWNIVAITLFRSIALFCEIDGIPQNIPHTQTECER